MSLNSKTEPDSEWRLSFFKLLGALERSGYVVVWNSEEKRIMVVPEKDAPIVKTQRPRSRLRKSTISRLVKSKTR